MTGLKRPTSIIHSGDGSGRLFVTEQIGRIRVIVGGKMLEEPFLDISAKITKLDPLCCDERGLLSVAFPPEFAKAKRVYVYYTGDKNEIFVSRFRVSEDNPNQADPSSEEIVFRFEHIYENHFGGQLAFNSFDRKLYFSIGDGAGGGNPLRSAQNPESPYGKIWRADVEGGDKEKELFALGLRNPWRFSFDRLNGEFFVGDVGENDWEEIDWLPRGIVGANFGWSTFEGVNCLEEADCGKPGFTEPIFTYGHDIGCSATSGYVYRGRVMAALQGAYLFGDFCYGKIWGATRAGEGWKTQLLFEDNDRNWSAFGEDEAGEIYTLDYLSGTVYRVEIAVEKPE